MKVAIVGPGLIGRSVALAARRVDADIELLQIDRGESLRPAAEADLIVLATPVDVTLDLLRNHSAVLRDVVTVDTGSTKREIVAAARDQGLDLFVGGHPMAGAATSGPDAARADLFDDRLWFLVTRGAADAAIARTTAFVTSLGSRPMIMTDDGQEHDRVMAAVSHLPQLVATTLMTVVGRAAGDRLGWAGSGLRDTTRLAASHATVWESILSTNATELRPLLREMAGTFERLAEALDERQKTRALFDEANRYRASLL